MRLKSFRGGTQNSFLSNEPVLMGCDRERCGRAVWRAVLLLPGPPPTRGWRRASMSTQEPCCGSGMNTFGSGPGFCHTNKIDILTNFGFEVTSL